MDIIIGAIVAFVLIDRYERARAKRLAGGKRITWHKPSQYICKHQDWGE